MPREINASELRKFFGAIFGPSVAGKICLAYKEHAEDKDKKPAMRQFFWNYPSELDKILEEIEKGPYEYFGVQLITTAKRTKPNTVPKLYVLWADLDECDLSKLHPKPSILVQSSPKRYQGYWVLVEGTDPETAELYSKKLAYAFADMGVDKSGWDLTQLLRIPGTTNSKYPGESGKVQIIFHNDTKYRLSDFDKLPDVPETPSTYGSSKLPEHLPKPDPLPNWITQLIEDDTKDRSSKPYRFFKQAAEVGYPYGVILSIVEEIPGFEKYVDRGDPVEEKIRLYNKTKALHDHEGKSCWRAGCANTPQIDEPSYGYEYDELTITINKQSDKEPEDDDITALIGKMLDCDQLDSLPTPTSLVEDMKDMDSVNWVVGKSGDGKSFCTISLAAAIGGGIPWMGKRVRQGQVVYIAAEGSNGIKLRKRAWELEHKRKMTGVLFLPMPVQAVNVPKGEVSYEWKVLAAACKKLGAVYIVIDTQARATVGVEENSSTQMGIFIDAAELLRRETKACIDIVHHLGRGNSERGRGSSSLDAAAETEIKVSSKRIDHPEGYPKLITISSNKQKERDDFPDMDFYLKIIDLGMLDDWGKPLTSCVLIPVSTDDDLIEKLKKDNSSKGMTVNLPIPIAKLKENFNDGSFSGAALKSKIMELMSTSKATAERRVDEMEKDKVIKPAPDSKSNNKRWDWV